MDEVNDQDVTEYLRYLEEEGALIRIEHPDGSVDYRPTEYCKVIAPELYKEILIASEDDVMLLVDKGLVDYVMNADGEIIYFPTEAGKNVAEVLRMFG